MSKSFKFYTSHKYRRQTVAAAAVRLILRFLNARRGRERAARPFTQLSCLYIPEQARGVRGD